MEAVMAKRTLTDIEKEALMARGPVSELTIEEGDFEGLTGPQRLSLSRQVAFLRAFAIRGIVLDGIEAAKVSRGLVNGYWRKEDEWFSTLYDMAVSEAADRIEAEAHRRAVTGYDEPVIYQGLPTRITDAETGEEKTLTVRKYSDQLMALLLKGSKPEKYRDNHKVEHGFGEGTTGVLVVPAPVDPEAWAKAAREQQAKYAGNTGDDNT